MSEVLTLVLAVLGAVPVLGGVVYALVRYGQAQVHRAEIDDRDEVIRLQKETIEAFEDRIGAFEATLETVNAKLDAAERSCSSLQAQLDEALAAHARLERYAAPEAVKSLQERFDTYAEASLDLLRELLGRVAPVQG